MQKCITCLEEKENVIKCFKECSYIQCIECTLKILKIQNKRACYSCPQCRVECKYNSLNDTEIKEHDEKFSEFCRNNPIVVDNIFSQIMKYKFKETNSVPVYDIYAEIPIFSSSLPDVTGNFYNDYASNRNITRNLGNRNNFYRSSRY